MVAVVLGSVVLKVTTAVLRLAAAVLRAAAAALEASAAVLKVTSVGGTCIGQHCLKQQKSAGSSCAADVRKGAEANASAGRPLFHALPCATAMVCAQAVEIW